MALQNANFFELNPRHADALKAAGWDSVKGLLAAEPTEDLHKEGLPDWRRRLQLTLGGQTYFLKIFDHPPKGEFDRRFGCPAEQERYWIAAVARSGVPVPEVAACGRQAGQSVLLLKKVPGQSLQMYVPEHGPDLQNNYQAKVQLIKAVAQATRTLHQAGLRHRDYYLAHLFFKAPEQITLIDLQRVFKPRLFKLRWAVKDLSALDYSSDAKWVSQTDRMRFWKLYAGVTSLKKPGAMLATARWVRRRTLWTQRRAARHAARKGQSVSQLRQYLA